MEFAWGGAVDPGGFISIWGCGQGQNFLHYCNKKVTADLNATKTQLNATKRNADFVAADQLMSNDVPAIPLYALPDIITFRSGLKNIVNNPAAGFTWNIEQWKWS
jgi:peptide/nickel transport system substrate-binding protein